MSPINTHQDITEILKISGKQHNPTLYEVRYLKAGIMNTLISEFQFKERIQITHGVMHCILPEK